MRVSPQTIIPFVIVLAVTGMMGAGFYAEKTGQQSALADFFSSPGSMTGVMIGMAVLMLSLVIWAVVQDRRRTAALAEKAAALGYSFREKAAAEDSALYARLGLENLGRSLSVRNILDLPAAANARVAVFDLQYTTGTGKNKQTQRQTAFMVSSPSFAVPAFLLQPEHFGHKLMELFGNHDIDLPHDPEFSRRYHLRGEDAARIADYFTPELTQFCIAQRNLFVAGGHGRIVLFRHRVLLKPQDLEAFLQYGQNVAGHFAAPGMTG